MSVIITWKNTDNSTVITSNSIPTAIPLGSDLATAAGSWKKLWVANSGTTAATNVNIDVVQSGTDPSWNYAEIAPDLSGAPDTANKKIHGQGGVNLGSLASGASKAFWLNIVLPSNATVATHPFKIKAQVSV